MKYFKNTAKILFIGLACLFLFLPSKLNIWAIGEEMPITCFETLPDINIKINAMDGFSSISEACKSLCKKYPCIKVNGTEDTVTVIEWLLEDESLISKYENKIAGEYSFIATIRSEKYNVYSISVPPTIKIILSDEEKISDFELEKLSDISISIAKIKGFETKEEAEKSILEKYSKIKIKGTDDFLEISGWQLSGDEYSTLKPGNYEFSAIFSQSLKYDVSNCLLKVRLIIFNEKKKITNFSEFKKITFDEISPAGWESKTDAEKTLLSFYKSISVNWGEGTVPIIAWNLSGGNYDSSRNGSYFFVPVLGNSNDYDTQNLDISPPAIEIVFNIPYGYASIHLYDYDGNDMANTAIKLENSNYSLYAESDDNGNKIFYAPAGEYEISVYYNGEKITKSIFISKEKTTYLKIKLGTDSKGKTSTTKAKSETTSAKTTTQTSFAESSESLWQNDGGISCETHTSNGFNIKVETNAAYLSGFSKNIAEDEFKDILKTVSSINFSKTSKKAKSAAEKVFSGLEANILPINFSAHKDFAFPVKISVFLGNGIYPKGEYFLYYYNTQTNEFEDNGTAYFDENGFLCFEISHCSDYFVSDKEIPSGAASSIVLSESNAQNKAVSFLNIEESQNSAKNKVPQSKIEVSSANIPVKIIFQEKSSENQSYLLLLINIAFILFAVLYLKRSPK